MVTSTRPCIYCGTEVTSTIPDVDYCCGCYYSGVTHQARFAPLLADIGHPDVFMEHTGGGIFALEVPAADDGGRLWATEDQDAGLPDTEDGPWWVWHYSADYETDEGTTSDEGDMVAEHLDRAGLVALIQANLPPRSD